MKYSILFLMFFAQSVYAGGYKGELSFTSDEVVLHRNKIVEMSALAAKCMQNYWDEHTSFFNSHCQNLNGSRVCLSKFYGDRRYSKQRGAVRGDGQPLQYLGDALEEAGFSSAYMAQMRSTSCIGMTLDCLKRSMTATGQTSALDKIRGYVTANDGDGGALQEGLRGLGWKVYYWNPALPSSLEARASAWDKEEQTLASQGHHLENWRSVSKRGKYYYNTVDNSTDLVGFESGTPEILKTIPFWIGSAHMGYHIFPGTFSNVIEAHSIRPITTIDNMQIGPFSPFQTGGSPRWTKIEKYRSGIIAIPPLD